ncbi:uncharacterized protein LOC116166782 isoform X2 [Photinus pyralis]|uniref:uncharacterized protein LOC116166782 isoform X2 n=1 Tax=Photinus pyralis TaxID=7054 RepID=UPI0012676B64|nr:uncharacterized protein LOC116166782 isoform X2 [Photinus pyralis]
MNIPPLTYSMFQKIECFLSKEWEDRLWISIEKAGIEEYDIAISKGQVDENGLAWVVVYTDCGWSQRSYGHSYNASSGVAVIIGKATGKILFLGVRNKYCSVCARAKKEDEIKEHICYKNWTASSGAMESDIIVEGFNHSISMHKIKYLKFIADGDSSVFAKIKQKVTYGNEVEKIHCSNHAVKNYGKALYKIKNDTAIALQARKFLTVKNIKALQEIAMKVLYENAHGLVEDLKTDLMNGPKHVYGDHSSCKESYCETRGCVENSKVVDLKNTGVYHHIYGALDRLVAKGHQLIDNETNNRAELYMSILCKFNAGKRLNLNQRGSFETRANLSGLRYNNGIGWQEESWKAITSSSPGEHFKNHIGRLKHQEANRKVRQQNAGPVKRKLKLDLPLLKCRKTETQSAIDYGANATQHQKNEEEVNSEKLRILRSLQVSQEDIAEIEKNTRGQWDNNRYVMERRRRLTASNFGEVCKRRFNKEPHNLVARILHPKNFYSEAVNYGKMQEKIVDYL